MVFVDNVDALRSWLVKKLTPICDADPQALAKYVVALLKKDKSESDLKASCREQLDVFLQKASEPFINELFDSLQTKSYLQTGPSSDLKYETRASAQDQKRKFKETRRFQGGMGRSPGRRPWTPETRRHDDRRHRRSPLGQRRHYGRRFRTPSPRRRNRYSASPESRKRSHRSRSPRRSRSPTKRKQSNSSESSASKRSSSSESNAGKNENENAVAKKKERCWDYNEKGFCIKGDSCPYDHGTDALVVNDFDVPNTTKDKEKKKPEKINSTPPQPPPPLPPHLMMRGPGLRIPFPPPPMPPMPVPPPSLMHRLSLPPLNMGMPLMQGPPPTRMIPLAPQGYNPEDPALNKADSNKSEAVVRKRPADSDTSSEPLNKRTYFNNFTGSYNKTLIVKKIPPILNNITKLNEHFAKFGAINNIQVKYNARSDEALVEFAHVSSARSAIRDSEAILNNRFIRVFWHSNEQSDSSAQKDDGKKPDQSVQYNPSPLTKADEEETTNSTETTPAAPEKLAVDKHVTTDESRDVSEPEVEETKKKDAASRLAAEKKAIMLASLAAQKKILEAREAVRQKTFERRKLVLLKKEELKKQREGLRQKQIEEQKLLLSKLKANRNMPAGEKAELLSTLKALTNTINSIESVSSNTLNKNKNEAHKVKRNEAESNDVTSTESDLSSLKKKLLQLKSEAGTLGILNTNRGGWNRGGRGRARGRGRGNSRRFIRPGSNLDRRPSALFVLGFDCADQDEILSHFSGFGELDTYTFAAEGRSCTIKFKNRHSAEQAISHGSFFKGHNLSITWSSSVKATSLNLSSTATAPQSLNNDGDIAPPSDTDLSESFDTIGADATIAAFPPADVRPDDEYGYGMLDEELDEEALLTGGDLDDDDEDDDLEERSWKH